MALALAVPGSGPRLAHSSAEYRPGVCNIGPDEVARRMRTGHLGAIATLVVLALLLALDVAPPVRLLVAIPAAAAAAGYLQALFRFCIAFGSLGVFNFGARGSTEQVMDPASRARDLRRVAQLSAGVALVAVAAGLAAVLIP